MYYQNSALWIVPIGVSICPLSAYITRNERKVGRPIINTDAIGKTIIFPDTLAIPRTTMPIRQLRRDVFISGEDTLLSQTQRHIVLHMVGHSLGLWHEHNRPDRDRFVQVRWNEIRAGQSNFFQKIPNNQVNSRNIPYDYLSIMHFGKSVSSNNVSFPYAYFNHF